MGSSLGLYALDHFLGFKADTKSDMNLFTNLANPSTDRKVYNYATTNL